MFKRLIGFLVGNMLDEIVTEGNYHEVADAVLDFFENLAAKSSNTLDDMAVAKIRQILKIPEGDD